MNKVKHALVVYYSLTGNTARVATDLASRLDADIESLQDKEHGTGLLGQIVAAFDSWRESSATIAATQHDPAEYDVVIIGTPIWTGRMTPAVRAYLQREKGKLSNVAFFCTSADTDIDKILTSLQVEGGCIAMAATGFNGEELRDPVTYERKLAALISAVPRARAAA